MKIKSGQWNLKGFWQGSNVMTLGFKKGILETVSDGGVSYEIEVRKSIKILLCLLKR